MRRTKDIFGKTWGENQEDRELEKNLGKTRNLENLGKTRENLEKNLVESFRKTWSKLRKIDENQKIPKLC